MSEWMAADDCVIFVPNVKHGCVSGCGVYSEMYFVLRLTKINEEMSSWIFRICFNWTNDKTLYNLQSEILCCNLQAAEQLLQLLKIKLVCFFY